MGVAANAGISRVPPSTRRRLLSIAGCVGLIVIPVWPGVYTIDSQAILRAAQNGNISNWYCPLHGFFWGLLDRLGIPVWLTFLAGTVCFVTAISSLLRALVSHRFADVVTPLIIIFPPVYGFAGWHGRDIWFVTEACAVLALSIRLLESREFPRRREVIALVVLAACAFDARQNGLPVPVVAACTLTWIYRSRIVALGVLPRFPTTKLIGATSAISFAILGSVMVGQKLVITKHHFPEQSLYIVDLTSASLITEHSMVPAVAYPDQDVDKIRRLLNGRDPTWVTSFDPPLFVICPWQVDECTQGEQLAAEVDDAYFDAWKSLVTRHPVTYLRSRSEVFGYLVGITQTDQTLYFSQTDEINPDATEWATRNGLFQTFPTLNRWRVAYLAAASSQEWLNMPILYISAGIISCFILAERHRAQRVTFYGLAAFQVAIQVPLFFMTSVHEARYEYLAVLLGSICLLADLAPRDSDRDLGEQARNVGVLGLRVSSATVPTPRTLGPTGPSRRQRGLSPLRNAPPARLPDQHRNTPQGRPTGD